jgi:hypothetical protein
MIAKPGVLWYNHEEQQNEEDNMDIGKAFGFVFEDENWIVKLLIAAAILAVGILFSWLLLIPLIVAVALLGGYGVEITRRVIRGLAPALPEWDDWGALLVDGIKVWVIGIVYALPAIILSACVGIMAAIAGEDSGAGVAISLCGSFFGFLWAIAMSLLMPAAIAFFAAEDDLGAAFRFGDVFALVRDNIATYLVTFVMSWVASLVGGLGSLVCGVGWLFTAPYGAFVTSHLYGQAYLETKGQGAGAADAIDQVDVFDEEFD